MIRGVLSVVLVLALVTVAGYTLDGPANAQDSNLLQNPGFEEPYLAIGGDQSLRVAQGWQPWSLPQGDSTAINARPEYKRAPSSRVHAGSSAQQYGTFFATHTGGVYQRVPVTPNVSLRFSVYVYVWSSATFDNPDFSEDSNDVQISVGIDPTGGTNGTSRDIVWSSPQEFYDQYREVSVTATARTNAVTVFVRTAPQGYTGTTDVYLDSAWLLPVGQERPTQPPSTRTPPPTFTPDTIFVPTQEGTVTPRPTAIIPTAVPTVVPTVPPIWTATPTIPDGFTQTVSYVVQRGDTVSELARRFGSSVSAIGQANGLSNVALIYVGQTLLIPVDGGGTAPSRPPTFTPIPTQRPGSGGPDATPPTGWAAYTVQRGDTLSAIASRYNTTATTLAQINNIVNPNLIYPGQELSVPGSNPTPVPPPVVQPSIHVVQPGENLFRISLRYNVTLDMLVRANTIYNPSLIFPGQQLTIPQ